MRNTITDDMIREAYKVAKRVLDKDLSVAEAVADLENRCKFNPNSALDLINNLKYMSTGKSYARTNKAFTTRHYLEMLYRDYGLAALKHAISAVEQHVTYYKALTGSSQPGSGRSPAGSSPRITLPAV